MRTLATIPRTAAAVLCALPLFPCAVPPASADEAQEWQRYYAPTTDWSRASDRDLNISRFVYRDRNRNGIYDIGDRPMASVVVEMTAPDGREAVSRSNIHGFANFKMSLADGADIGGAGAFSFRVVVPPGWEATSGNPEQTSVFRLLEGSPAGIVAEVPPDSVGLAPRLTIAGRLARRTGGTLQPVADGSVTATAPDGRSFEVAVAADGGFLIPASQGAWLLTARAAGGDAVVRREIRVRETPLRMSAMVLGDPDRAPAPRTIELDFEDASNPELAKLPSGVAGLTWDHMNVAEAHFYDGEGYVNATTSGRHVGYNSSGHPVTISDKDGFDFVGASFGLAWRKAEGEKLVVRAWRDGSLVGEEILGLSSLGPVWFDADYRQIDTLTLATRHYWQFVTDDMVFRVEAAER